MFGSVTSTDILARLEEEGIQLEKKQLNVAQPIKDLGSHKIQVKLNSEIEATFNLEIVSENPIIAESEAGSIKRGRFSRRFINLIHRVYSKNAY